ncbi:hypothetical protein FNYG_11085 [Fusarium nygamai]|uniref:TFIIS-type domain-containing protein n=1 Tax=Gibberella nygamai TaxID=42673 RepID=A0A2K0W088_GIBNY|nr:hypothetical protein FNYG_11085 [Fusarium nygamai]
MISLASFGLSLDVFETATGLCAKRTTTQRLFRHGPLLPHTGSKVTVTQTKPSDFPSFLRQKLQSSVQAVEKHNLQTDSTVRETCPKCGREEVKYTNVQLRGADEGSTVIYLCDCGNSWHENN